MALPTNWKLVTLKTYRAKPDGKGGFIPIPDFSLQVNQYALLIGVKSNMAKPHWVLGCRASFLFFGSPSGRYQAVEVKREVCFLNRLNYFEAPRYEPLPYRLAISVPRWLSQIELEVWSSDTPSTPLTMDIQIVPNP
jgi:hypothetical protein